QHERVVAARVRRRLSGLAHRARQRALHLPRLRDRYRCDAAVRRGLLRARPLSARAGEDLFVRHARAARVRAVDGDRVRLLPDRRGHLRRRRRLPRQVPARAVREAPRPRDDHRLPRAPQHPRPLHARVRAASGSPASLRRRGVGASVLHNVGPSPMNAPIQPPAVPKTQLLLELRPALEGFAGIPQETRLLFRGLRKLENVEVKGLLQTSHRILSAGTTEPRGWFATPISEDKRINRYSRVIISTVERPYRMFIEQAVDWVQKGILSLMLSIWSMSRFRKLKLTDFQSKHFGDFMWRTLFSKSLSASDYELVASADLKIL